MARIEKTVFISYRRKDISWALAVYQYLTSQKYDVFFDYTSLSGGDFEQVIVSNIKARAHFVLILTPTALDRCNELGDWLRREIETAIDEKRNIIPLFFDGFSFGSPAVAERLTGKLANINRYNGLDVPSGYFMEAMERLRSRYLNVPLDAVIHPVSTEVRKVVKEEKVAANKALRQQQDDIQELVKPVEEKPVKPKQAPIKKETESSSPFRRGFRGEAAWRPYVLGAGILLLVVLGIAGISSLVQNARERESLTATATATHTSTNPLTSTQAATITLTPTTTITSTPSEPFSYTFEEGDTLQGVAEKFNLGDDGVLLLLEFNPTIVENGGVYFVGQTILVPPPGTKLATATPLPPDLPRGTKVEYKVLPGDTLAGIAAKFNSVMEDIIAANNIEANAIYVGQVLQIPVNLVTPTTTLPVTSTSHMGVGSTRTSPKDGMTLLYVPAGEFVMGSDDGYDNEKPVQVVYLDAFWIDQTEVTNVMYAICVKERECNRPHSVLSQSRRDGYYGLTQFHDYPVIYVSWDDAKRYCSWAGRRLPTEAEWEKAARGEDGREYPWGNGGASIDSLNFFGTDTTEVGKYPRGASPYGVLDMAGNVSEWVSSLYQSYPYNASDGREDLSASESRVIRGGFMSYHGIRSTYRSWNQPSTSSDYIGFRCAMSATP